MEYNINLEFKEKTHKDTDFKGLVQGVFTAHGIEKYDYYERDKYQNKIFGELQNVGLPFECKDYIKMSKLLMADNTDGYFWLIMMGSVYFYYHFRPVQCG